MLEDHQSSENPGSSTSEVPATAGAEPEKKPTAKKTAAKKTAAKKTTTRKTAAKKAVQAPDDPQPSASEASEPEAPPKKKATKKATAAKKATAEKPSAKKGASKQAVVEEAPPATADESAASTPAVLFQAPDAAKAPPRRARKAAPAEEGETEDKPDQGKAAEKPGKGKNKGKADQGKNKDKADQDKSEGGPDTSDRQDQGESDDSEGGGGRRRRRRGGRRRRKSGDGDGDAAGQDESEKSEGASADDDAGGDDNGDGGTSRRRRRRRRAGDEGDSGGDDPANTVTKVRQGRSAEDQITAVSGSTRLEAKKQRRREGREAGRRRAPIISEAEFLARRESVDRAMVIRQREDLTQIAVLEDKVLVEHYVARESQTSLIGNVYLGRVQNVLPSMEAAFIDIGKGRNAVLYAGEVNFEALGMGHGPRRIESALKSGQSVLVQVTKDPIGHKGARLTSQVSLPGRYLVYVPEGSMTGISRKLPDTERARLKTILKKIVPEDAGVIVRTAAEGASEDELRRDVERLQAQWEEIKKKSKNGAGSAPTLLYGEPDMTVRVVRDIFNEDFSKVVVSGDEAWETVHGYVSHVAPDLAERLSRWTSEVDVFATYRIDEQLAKALDRKVWLPSGGSLVIDRTEAMIVVDVNTGKFTGQGGNLEETVTRNNLEAAEEIVRQLRLRDLGGIIVIDFIDMVLESNRDLVLRRLLECLGRDRTKHQVAEVTSLGLVQMTRKRVGQGLLESFSETCVHCNGRGVIVHLDQPAAAGGGGKRRKRARAGAAEQPHEHEAAGVETAEQEAETETAAEVAAEAAEPVALPAPEFVPDEELYSSAAEAEAAATRGRTRRRASRRASAPAGAPKRETARAGRRGAEEGDRAEAPTAQDVTAAEEIARPVRPEPAAEALAEPAAVEDAVVPEPAAEEAAPKGRTRRRATRKVSAPAGSPAGAEAAVVTVAEPAAPVAEAPAAEAPKPEETPVEAPAEAEAPARPRRRAVRKAGTSTASEDTAVVVVPSAAAETAPAEEPSQETAGEPSQESAEEPAAAKKTARKAAKKATAKKAAVKKTAAKKTAAKKTTAKKAAAKTTKSAATKTTAKKSASKKTAAAAQQPSSSVTASTED